MFASLIREVSRNGSLESCRALQVKLENAGLCSSRSSFAAFLPYFGSKNGFWGPAAGLEGTYSVSVLFATNLWGETQERHQTSGVPAPDFRDCVLQFFDW